VLKFVKEMLKGIIQYKNSVILAQASIHRYKYRSDLKLSGNQSCGLQFLGLKYIMQVVISSGLLVCIALLSLINPLMGLIAFVYTFIFIKLISQHRQIILSAAFGVITILLGIKQLNVTEIHTIASSNWNMLTQYNLKGYVLLLKQAMFQTKQIYSNGTLSLGGMYLLILAGVTYVGSFIQNKTNKKQMTKINIFQAESKIDKNQILKESNSQDYIELGIKLGIDKSSGEPITISHKELNQHALVIGTTGSGKTNTLLNIVKSCCEQGLPLIYLDGKGSIKLAQSIAKLCSEYNRTLKVFSVDPNPDIPGLAKYNPLAFGNFTEWQNKMTTLLGDAENKGQEHYLIEEQSYINIVCEVLNKSGKYIDFEGMLGYLNHPDELQKLANKIDPNLAMRLVKATPKKSETSDVVKLLEMFYHSHYGQQFSTSDVDKSQVINLQQSLENNEVVLFLFDAASYKRDTSALGKLVINDINAAFSGFGRSGRRVPAYCIFDEFGAYASGNMANVLAMQRDNGLHAIVGTQSIHAIAMESSQVKRIAVELIANCNTFVIHKINDPQDITLLCNTIGKQEVFKTQSISYAENEQLRVNNVLNEDYILDGGIIRTLALGDAYLCRTANINIKPKLIKVNLYN
jgi:hypothetical protein